MKFEGQLYYCSHCRKILPSLDEMLFVEEGTPRGFCCEKCIEDFYAPVVLYFEQLEKKYRQELKLSQEACLNLIHAPRTDDSESAWSLLMDEAIRYPDEIYRSENKLKEEHFYLIKHFERENFGKFSIIVLSFLFDQQVSFILAATVTASDKMLNRYRIGEKIKVDIQQKQEQGISKIDVDPEIMELLEVKKSAVLADMIDQRSPADIPIESFNLYDDYFVPTLEEPDEIFLSVDKDGDEIYTYIKAHDREGVSFYYVIMCLKYQSNLTNAQDTVLPIIAFPTVDGEQYRNYRRGTLVSGHLKN